MCPSAAEPASCGPNDSRLPDGRAPALSEETPTLGPGRVGMFKIGTQVFARRDRWGKVNRLTTCDVCGRRLFVNWTRARPCLFCDEAALLGEEAKAR